MLFSDVGYITATDVGALSSAHSFVSGSVGFVMSFKKAKRSRIHKTQP